MPSAFVEGVWGGTPDIKESNRIAEIQWLGCAKRIGRNVSEPLFEQPSEFIRIESLKIN